MAAELRALPCQLDMHRRCSGRYARGPEGAGRLWLYCFCDCHNRTEAEMKRDAVRLTQVGPK